MSLRKALRDAVATEVGGIARMSDVTQRAIMVRRPDLKSIPEWSVVTPEEVSQESSEDDLDRFVQVEVIVRRKGDSAPDDLDDDADALEAALLPALKALVEVETCELQRIRFDYDTDGSTPIGQVTLQLQVFYYAARIGS